MNVHRHSNSATASVSLNRESGKVRLCVCDEGTGMNPGKESDGLALGVGLLGIRERIRQLDGKLEIHSEKGKGTEVLVWVPDKTKDETPTASTLPRINIDSSAVA